MINGCLTTGNDAKQFSQKVILIVTQLSAGIQSPFDPQFTVWETLGLPVDDPVVNQYPASHVSVTFAL
jgi:hypothetical protein